MITTSFEDFFPFQKLWNFHVSVIGLGLACAHTQTRWKQISRKLNYWWPNTKNVRKHLLMRWYSHLCTPFRFSFVAHTQTWTVAYINHLVIGMAGKLIVCSILQYVLVAQCRQYIRWEIGRNQSTTVSIGEECHVHVRVVVWDARYRLSFRIILHVKSLICMWCSSMLCGRMR